MIASFYGMNVDVYIAEWHYSFIAIMIISVIISAIAFVLFKRIKWF